MIEVLRAKPVKAKNIKDGVFEIKKNTPIQICKENNSHKLHIIEKDEKEDCYISSTFHDDSFAMVGNEFCLNFLSDPKKVDISYYYFSVSGKSIVYLYDMKKTFAGIDVLMNLIEQWTSSIKDAKYCIDQLDSYSLNPCSDIHIGVLTENNAVDRRTRELKPILHPEPLSEKIPEYQIKKQQASSASRISQAKILAGFDEGKVTILGSTYKYDVRLFTNKTHEMLFFDGILER